MYPYYKIIDIPDIDNISHQVDLALPRLVVRPPDLKQVFSFNTIDTGLLLQLSPALKDWLDSIGLTTHLQYAGLPCAAPHSQGDIHTDGKSTEAINLPIYNCDQGYSVWYQSSCVDTTPESVNLSTGIPHSHADAVELARVSNRHPIWFNTTIPHRGINMSSRPRIIMTLRFDCPIPIDTL